MKFKILLFILASMIAPNVLADIIPANMSTLKFEQINSSTSIFVLLTVLSFIPFLVIATTTFARNIIVLSFVRQALGLQQTPPNIVLIVLALFLSFFVMSPILTDIYNHAFQPFMANQLPLDSAAKNAWLPLKTFMISQTREADILLIHELAKAPLPKSPDDLLPLHLIPAFMLSELTIAFKIGFVILVPFLIIDLIVASILMSLGMIMVPPVTIALPLKIMLFLLIDGWGLIAQTLIKSVN